ncbi:oxidoreductase [Pacificimonas flava]|uniref:Oxidoreductase n=2 Tax=Pacificimonas TaxID=1960290 RepID=A0A219B2Q1_9SPHN|nr:MULTISPECIES: aldo/keto reductase [Pacificimonas]MBZ6377944.1 aldo/keto reductase [Pacificimonas aurantium]OWV32403.1 oxidoreductase [Pacificimonas flava]
MIQTLTLNDGRRMPQLGFGTYKIDDDAAPDAVRSALGIGYDLVDTAAVYGNEQGVGTALQDSDAFLTTKVWNESQGFERAKKAFEKSLSRLGRDSVDLLLIHWPCPKQDLYVETWKAFIELREAGKAKSIGVSNFREEDLARIITETGVTPAVNQIELHPAFQQHALRRRHKDLGIITQSWSPLGQGAGLSEAVISDIAAETGQPASAVVLRWHLQHGLSPIPKASKPDHMQANFTALSFELSEEQMARIDELDDQNGRIGPEPGSFG